MREYMVRNHESWYALAKRLDHDVRREEIILVSGCVKTSSWAGIAWSSESTHHNATLSVSLCGSAAARFRFLQDTDTGLQFETRCPSPPTSSQRHCIFLNYYKLN